MEVRIARGTHEITVSLEENEERLLVNLCQQLLEFLLSYSGQGLDPDPLLASLEVGGSSEPPSDIALRALFPDAFFGDAEASAEFRSTTELGLINRKAQDAIGVLAQLGYHPNGTRIWKGGPADAVGPAAAGADAVGQDAGSSRTGDTGTPGTGTPGTGTAGTGTTGTDSADTNSTEAGSSAADNFSNRIVLEPADFEKWMRTLTSLRLVIAARIGVVSESDEQALEQQSPQQEAAMQIMHFLGALLDFITETALETL